MTRPAPDIVARVERLLGWAPESWRPVHGGYTPTARYAVAAGHRTGFVKVATTEMTAWQINREIAAYSGISGDFVPHVLGADPDRDRPILIIEDLSHASWPPPWTDAVVEQVLDTIARMHATPSTLAHGGLLEGREAGWPTVAADPAPFSRLASSLRHGWNAPCRPSSSPNSPASSPATPSRILTCAATTSALLPTV